MVLVVMGNVKAGSALYHNAYARVFSLTSLEHHIPIQLLQVQLEFSSQQFEITSKYCMKFLKVGYKINEAYLLHFCCLLTK